MILADYAQFLQTHKDEIMKGRVTPLELLPQWLETIINKNPKNNIEKIVHKEIMYCKNEIGDFLIVGKSDSGRKLVTSLINFAQSYENYNRAKWLEMIERKYHDKISEEK